VLGWEPRISLEEGLARTYEWIEEQVRQSLARQPMVEPIGEPVARGVAGGAPMAGAAMDGAPPQGATA
jgi:hypothetical protein